MQGAEPLSSGKKHDVTVAGITLLFMLAGVTVHGLASGSHLLGALSRRPEAASGGVLANP